MVRFAQFYEGFRTEKLYLGGKLLDWSAVFDGLHDHGASPAPSTASRGPASGRVDRQF